jgi:hypothetical protein
VGIVDKTQKTLLYLLNEIIILDYFQIEFTVNRKEKLPECFRFNLRSAKKQ